MGHNTLGIIPGKKSWRDVVAMLDSPAADDAVIAASAKAAERDMLAASDDPVFVEAMRLLLMIPYAARSEDFGQALRDADLDVQNKPELMDLVVAATARLDQVRRETGARSDLGELAGRALASTLSTNIGDALPGLFGGTPEDVQLVAKKYSWSKGIAELSRSFFGDVVSNTLRYWLDRKLDDHVGAGQRYETVARRSAFDVELESLTSEAGRIIQEFSGGWYGKTLHRDKGVSSDQAAAFGAVALKKIVAELRVRNERND